MFRLLNEIAVFALMMLLASGIFFLVASNARADLNVFCDLGSSKLADVVENIGEGEAKFGKSWVQIERHPPYTLVWSVYESSTTGMMYLFINNCVFSKSPIAVIPLMKLFDLDPAKAFPADKSNTF